MVQSSLLCLWYFLYPSFILRSKSWSPAAVSGVRTHRMTKELQNDVQERDGGEEEKLMRKEMLVLLNTLALGSADSQSWKRGEKMGEKRHTEPFDWLSLLD